MKIMRNIEKHDTEREVGAIESAERLKNKGPQRILEISSGSILGTMVSRFYDAFIASDYLKLGSERTTGFLSLMSEAGAGNFNCVRSDGKTFSFTIDGETYEMIGSHHSAYTDPQKWLSCIYAAIAVRNTAAIETLIQVPDEIFDKANIKGDPLAYALADIYKNLFGAHQDRSLVQLISHAYNLEPAERPKKLDFNINVNMPQLGIIRTILSPDSENEYNELMKEAVLSHIKYWSQDEYEYEGWVSLPLIALASIAFDHKGYRLNFETDYIPRWLVEREFS